MKHTLELTDSMTTLQARSGEIILLTGKVGSGKTLWLHRLAALADMPPSMTITLDGTDKHRVRLLFDRWPYVWLGQTVEQELMFGLKIQPAPQQLEKTLADWGLSDLSIDTELQTLNRIQSLRLSLAAMSLAQAALILLDNPTAALGEFDAHALINDMTDRDLLANAIMVVACNRWQDWQSSASQIWQITRPNALPQAGIQV
jgi:energy-coupling factor transporter ATP-binding protein EcfA2